MVLNQQKEGSHNIDYNKVNFFDCLADYFKSTTLDTDNLRRCEFCARENQAILQYRMKTCKLKITRLPNSSYPTFWPWSLPPLLFMLLKHMNFEGK